MLFLLSLLLTSLSLTLLEGSLRSQRIDLRLSIMRLLLQLTQSLHLLLLLSLNALLLGDEFLFALGFASIILDDFLLQLLFFELFFLLDHDGFSVALLNFLHEELGVLHLLLSLAHLFLFEVVDLLQYHMFLLLHDLSFLDALQFSFFDLVHDHQGTLSLSLLPLNFPLLLKLETLESLNLHHDVESLLLISVLVLQLFLLLKLPVPDGHTL